ncbi:MAG: TonB-dependent receptor, partial [Gemmatimonadota bacterium]
FYSESYAETAGSLPESVFGTSPRTNFTAGDFEDLSLVQVSAFGYARVGPGRGSATLYVRSHDAERFNVNQAPDPDVRGISENRTFGGNLDWRGSRRYGDRVVALRLGLDGALNSVDVQLFEEDAGGATLTTDVSSPSWDLASYAIADYLVGRVTVSGGLRFDYIEIPFDPRVINGSPAVPGDSATHVFRRLSPRGGVSVQVSPTAVAYGSVGQSFRAPVVLELACADPTAACPLPFALGDDPPLDAVVATTFELGARWALGPASLDAALYRTEVQDDIFFIASETAVFEGHFANIGDTRRQGVELGVEIPLEGGHRLYGNYAFTHATFQTDAIEIFSLREEADSSSVLFGENEIEKGSRIPLVPAHQIRAGASLVLPHGFRAGLDARYTGEQWFRGDEANEVTPLDGYAVADLRLEWEGRGFGIAALVTNLFDSDKAVFGTFNENRNRCDPVTGECEVERFLTPMQARAIKLIVRRDFGG